MKLKVNRTLFTLLLLVLVASQSEPSAASNDPVFISYVSTVVDSSSSSLSGSMKGGTALYIHGLGFDPTSSHNQIYVGEFPCDTSAKGVTVDTITCDTTAPTTTAISNLPISVVVTGKNPYTCTSSSCAFSYSSSNTPVLRAIYPKSGGALDQIKFYGVHRIVDLGVDGRTITDVRGLYIGSLMCSRFDISEGPINANSNQFITCAIPPIQEGGYYNLTEWVTPGYADKSPRMLTGSLGAGANYEFAVTPVITGVSSHLGGSAGQTITITGNGFTTNQSRISVTAANIPCTISASSSNSITCVVQANINGNTFGLLSSNTTGTQTNGFYGGSGLKYTRYNISALSDKTVSGLRTAIAGSSASISVLESGTRGDIVTPDIYGSEAYGQVFSGYFRAPNAGNYIFRGLADDFMAMYVSSVTGSAEIDYTSAVISSVKYSESNSDSNYYLVNTASLTSAPIAMAAGESRYIEVYHLNTGGSSSLMVSVEVPNTNDTLANTVYEVQKLTTATTIDPEILNFTVSNA